MNLRRKLLAFLKSQKKNAEYTELEYLESTGTQYIDTGFLSNQLYDKSLYIKMKTTGGTSSYAYNGAYHISGTGLTVQFGLLATSDTLCRTTLNHFDPSYLNVTNLQKSEYTEMMMTPNEYWVNGELKSTHEQTSVDKILETNNPFFIFGRSQYNAANSITPMIISEFWIKDANGKFVQHLIPVLDKDFVPCMYDKVSGRFLYNQGTGEFKWKLPNQLEYLELTGKQWIDTGIVPLRGDELTVTNVQCSKGSDFRTVFSAGVSTYQLILLVNNTSGTTGVDAYLKYFGSGGASNVKTNLNNPTDIKLDSKGDLYYNDVLVASNTPQGNVDTNLYLFKRANDTSFMIGKAGIFTIKRDGKFIRYLIPVFDENLNVCMYDLVEKKYYYNQGSDVFKGYFEDGSRLVAYLESVDEQYIDTLLLVTDKTGAFIDAEWVYENTAFSTLSGSYQSFMVFAIVPASRKICYSYNSNSTGTTTYPLKDGTFVPSNEQSGVDPSLFITENGRFKVGLNYLDSGKWTYETVSESYENDLIATVKNDSTITLFGRRYNAAPQESNSYLWKGKIYSANFTEGDKIVRRFVPVVKSDNTACMLDLIYNQYFVNKGKGSFTYGTVANLFNPTNPSYVAGYVSTNNNGNITASTLTDTFYIPCKPNTTYLITRSSVKESNQVWRAATVSETPYVNMLCPNYVGGLNNDLTLTITSRDNDRYLMFSEGRTMATDDLTKFTVVELGSGSFSYG